MAFEQILRCDLCEENISSQDCYHVLFSRSKTRGKSLASVHVDVCEHCARLPLRIVNQLALDQLSAPITETTDE